MTQRRPSLLSFLKQSSGIGQKKHKQFIHWTVTILFGCRSFFIAESLCGLVILELKRILIFREHIYTINKETSLKQRRFSCLYTMKTQVFIDGNKRAAVIFANHFLIAHGQGFLVIQEAYVSEFKKLLVAYYEGDDAGIIIAFLKDNCWKTF